MNDQDKQRIAELIGRAREYHEHLELVQLHNKYVVHPRATNSTCGGCVQRMVNRLNELLNKENEKTES